MSAVIETIRDAGRITAICHENPDADTLGAALAVQLVARRLGKQSEVVCADPVPDYLAFLPGSGAVRRAPALDPDVAVIVDAGDLPRIGSVAAEHADWLRRATIVNIDHHVSNPSFGAANLIDPEAASTCEIIAELLPTLRVALDPELATLLLAGMVNDTHTFSHPNVTPRTLRVAAELVEAGAALADIHRAIYADKPFSTMALWGLILAGIAERDGGRVVHAAMTRAMLDQTGSAPTASEGFVDMLGMTRDADITVLFKEIGPQEVRVSVRTSARADAVAVTSAFGGGGHVRAAGCTVTVPLAEARELVLAECQRELARSDARRH